MLNCFAIALPIGYVGFYQIPTFFVKVFFIINKLYLRHIKWLRGSDLARRPYFGDPCYNGLLLWVAVQK